MLEILRPKYFTNIFNNFKNLKRIHAYINFSFKPLLVVIVKQLLHQYCGKILLFEANQICILNTDANVIKVGNFVTYELQNKSKSKSNYFSEKIIEN